MGPIFFNNFIFTPSRSRLFLGSNSFIILTSEAGDVGPSSRSGGFGLGGMKSSGSSEVGLTVSEMEGPILLKKVLNSSATSNGSLQIRSLIMIESIFCVVFVDFIASLRISHVFLGFFSLRLRLSEKYRFLLFRINEL